MKEMSSNGQFESANDQHSQTSFDVAVVGGGPAGLSAALTLSRALRRPVVIDSGKPRNAPASHMHGYLGYDGVPPRMLLENGRAEIESYGATFLEGTVISARLEAGDAGTSFQLALASGRQLTVRRLLIAAGSMDLLPDLPGLEEVWGTDVHVCPYCHGYEVRNQPLAVIATGEHCAHYALMIRHWSSDLIYFENERGALSEEQTAQFEAMGIRRVRGAVRRMVTNEGRLQAIEMDDGDIYERSAAFLSSTLAAHSELLEALGVEIQQTAQGSAVVVDPQGRTTVPGVWAAGNITNPSFQVISAAAAGNLAGASINMDLIQEDQERIVNVMLHEG